MKTFLTSIVFTFFFLLSQLGFTQIYLAENFENAGARPTGWTEKYEGVIAPWIFKDGGIFAGGENHPTHAYEGSYNAAFIYSTSYITKLITPELKLATAKKPELTFWHAMQAYAGDIDYLFIYFKNHPDSAWHLIQEYTSEVPDWTRQSIYIPDSLGFTNTSYIAFEGRSSWGAGVCIDSVTLTERGLVPKQLSNVYIKSVTNSFIPTGSSNNVVLRIDFEVSGNSGDVIFDSLAVKSLNTSNDDITSNGVKLFFTGDTIFRNYSQISSATNFIDGIAIFDNINISLPYGYSSAWVTYDIKTDPNHQMHNHTVDALVEENSIKIGTSTYPFVEKSPSGSRKIYESILYDNFETDLGWSLYGEFERSIPLGLGSAGYYSPDPSFAQSGINVIGTDLTGKGTKLGDYESGVPPRFDKAISPSINAKYYKDVTFAYYRWLNIDNFDSAFVDISLDNGTSWSSLWVSDNYYNERTWNFRSLNISLIANREQNVKIRYSLGPTDGTTQAGGWNIDDFSIVGNYISKDVGITSWISPISGCGHTNEEYVTVTIKNFAGDPLNDPLPLSYSFNGGTTIYRDTIQSPNLEVEETLTYQITKPIDLTTPGWYNNIYATTNLPGDEDATNDRIDTALFVAPTYTLPHSQNFESNYGYYLTGGVNSSWTYGTPTGAIINSAASGTKAWVTSLITNYNNYEDSYLESPCFNFAGIDYPVFEFKSKGLSEDSIDGLALYYSIDDGENWDIAPSNNDFNWNWYNEDSIASLGDEGIDTTDGIWKTFRQLLPIDTRNISNVKFRFVFKSNESSNYEGFGIDDIKIYDAPADVGVTEFVYPYDTCEWNDTTHIIVKIKNFGLDTLKTGSKIPVGYKFNNGTTKRDTLTLAANLIPNASVNFMFNSTVDMSYAGDYAFAVFTTLEANPYLYSSICNDTIRDTISVFGMPRYDIGNIMGAIAPIDTFIVAGIGYSDYDWTWTAGDAVLDSVVAPSDTLYVKAEDWYKVTVTNSRGCTATDSVRVVPSLVDLKMDSLYTVMKDSCERLSLTEISVHVLNKGLMDFGINDTVYFGYQINNNPIVYDTLKLTKAFENTSPNDTAYFTFTQKADFRNPGEYQFKVFTNFGEDLVPEDDTLSFTINTWGFPDVELAYDSITSSQADTLLLIATPGYNTYSWNTAPVQTNDTLVPANETRWNVVTVTDIHSCGSDKDSTYINAYDLGVTAINNLKDTCENDVLALTAINVDLKNYSGDTYLSTEVVDFYYSFDNAPWVHISKQIGSALGSNDTISLNIDNIDISTPGLHTLKVYSKSAKDANHANDTSEISFNTWEFPDVNLAFDTIYTTQADTVILIADPGFATYLWTDFSDNDSLILTDKTSQKYVVEVADIHGCGTDKDSTQIIAYNLGVKSLVAPISACSHITTESVTIQIENSGNDIYYSGQTIPVGFIFNGGAAVYENKLLTADLYPTQTTNYTFTQKVDMVSAGTYTLKVFTGLDLDVYRENDTIYDGIRTFGYPVVEIGPDVVTHQPDTVIFVANPGYNNYTWNEGTRNDSLEVSLPQSFEYIVTVTSINGCATKDTVSVFTTNIAASELVGPVSTCEWTSTESVTVKILNTCSDTISAGETIEVGYKLGTGNMVTENHVLVSDLLPDSTVNHTFAATVDLSTETGYSFKVFARSALDVYLDDSVSVNILEAGYPSFELGDDIYITNPVGTVLSAPVGYASYLWQNGSTNNTFTISYPATAEYKVTVANAYGCESSDSLMVYTYNLAADTLIAPVSQCELSNTETIIVGIINNGSDTLLVGETINVSYSLNSGALVNESFDLIEDLYPDSIVEYSFTQTANMLANQLHEIMVFAMLSDTDVYLDDTLVVTVDVQKPDLDLGADVYTTEDEVLLDAGSGYTSYLWYNGSTDQTLTVNVNNQTANYYYSVTVTNSLACSATDSVLVSFDVTPDLSVTELVSPASDCLSDSLYYVDVEITNSGGLDISAGSAIEISYEIDEGAPVTENHNLTAALLSGNTVVYRFADRIPFTAAKTYEFKMYLSYTADTTHSNDTLISSITISSPDFEFSADTLKVTAFNYDLDAGPWSSYLWHDGRTTRVYPVSAEGWYKVTVSDVQGCEATDSVYVMLSTGIDRLIQGENFVLSYYPNPVQDQLSVNIEAFKPIDLSIELLNTQGQTVYRNQAKAMDQITERIFVGDFAKGVYYIRFTSGKESFVRKLVIQ